MVGSCGVAFSYERGTPAEPARLASPRPVARSFLKQLSSAVLRKEMRSRRWLRRKWFSQRWFRRRTWGGYVHPLGSLMLSIHSGDSCFRIGPWMVLKSHDRTCLSLWGQLARPPLVALTHCDADFIRQRNARRRIEARLQGYLAHKTTPNP